MHHPRAVRPVQRVGDLSAEREHLGHRQRPLLQPVREGLPLEQLHHQIVHAILVADVVQRADVRVVQLGDGAGLALEAGAHFRGGGQMRGQHLDRHVAAEAGVVGAVHLAHPPRAE